MPTPNHIQYEGSESYPSHIIVPDGYFLNDSIPFNYRLYTPLLLGYAEYLYSRIYLSNRIYKRAQKLLALNCTVSNLLTAHYNYKSLAYSRNRNTYTIGGMYGMEHYTYTNIVSPIDWLLCDGYVNQAPGFFDSERKTGRNSRIWATPKFIEEVEAFIWNEIMNCSIENLTHQLKYENPIVLKNKKHLINYRPNAQSVKMKRFLEDYNPFMKSQEISLPLALTMRGREKNHFQISNFLHSLFNYSYSTYLPTLHYNSHISNNIQLLSYTNQSNTPLLRYNDTNYLLYKGLNTALYRVFNNSFKFGGRFYGGDYQGLPKDVRKNILIGGEKVSEMDFSSLHLSMLYHLSGIDYKEDPYLAINDNPELRSLYKLISLIIINSNCKGNAVRGFNTEVYRDSKKKRNRRFHKEKLERYKISFSDLYNQFVDTHKDLEPYFLSGVGIKLQNIDSHIAQNVMSHFLKKSIPCICIHDSFIVPEKYEDELKTVMKETYKSKFKYDIKVK